MKMEHHAFLSRIFFGYIHKENLKETKRKSLKIVSISSTSTFSKLVQRVE